MDKPNNSRLGKYLNAQWGVAAKHALYREDGAWYHNLKRFPGALFDADGYILFNTEEEYQSCKYLRIGKHLHVPDSISSIPGYVYVGNDKLAEEVSDTGQIIEGAVKRITINAYERNSTARKKCIAHHGHKCAICSFDFEETYGSLGENFIHVHHLKQLSEIKMEYVVDPIRDLIPVCPNCHAMLHRREPPLTINELQLVFKKMPE
jgi:hypothetical protein